MSPDPSTVHIDPVTAAGEVSRRLELWLDERGLDLPPATRAQFVEMGMQALQRWPERSSGDVLDELVADLDARLASIEAERPADAAPAQHQRRGLGRWLRRWRK